MKPSGKRIANIKPSFLLVKDIKLGHNVIWFFHTALTIVIILHPKITRTLVSRGEPL